MSICCLVVGNNEIKRNIFINLIKDTMFNDNVFFTEDLDIDPHVVVMLYEDTDSEVWSKTILAYPDSNHLFVTFEKKHETENSVNNIPVYYIDQTRIDQFIQIIEDLVSKICSYNNQNCQRTIGFSHEY